ncbi:Origin recognition complex subunit 2 [Hondaea fermentalgiana]|uniref:Origin recognition complex subunit 2 n=1 Tax=Hondaea fermentalgiana TaxID=2315210 RepID=A0A2R5GGR0_9STRA|nr:Origin recognition complex subunit 2 [Hondaea fermentalgiana]|eukprot:GBG30072.1 Origin recognition complex subunit 2 [Hondaea fermentalgiana]
MPSAKKRSRDRRHGLVGRVVVAGPRRGALVATPMQPSPQPTPARSILGQKRRRDEAHSGNRSTFFSSDDDDEEEEEEEEDDGNAVFNDDNNGVVAPGVEEDDDDENEDKGEEDDGDGKGRRRSQKHKRVNAAKSGLVSTYFDMETNAEMQKRRRNSLASLRAAHTKAKIKSAKTAQAKTSSRTQDTEVAVRDAVTALVRYLPRDYVLMEQGFNILVHGFGSKKRVLEGYATAIGAYERARKRPASCIMVMSGFSATLNVRAALATLLQHYIGLSETESLRPSRSLEAMSTLAVELSTEVARRRKIHIDGDEDDSSAIASRQQPVRGFDLDPSAPVWTRNLFLIVHNIDGSILRGLGPKRALSLLAQSPQVHLVASVDHIAAELLWDPKQLENCRWVWREVTTRESYLFEGIGAPSLVRGQDVHGSRGAAFVLSSLTPNHISVLEVLADTQLEITEASAAAGSTSLPGMEFADLLNVCRDQMFVSTERALRSLLVEFKDHSILGTRLSPDGKELLYLTHDPSVIKREIDKINGLEA